MTMPAGKYYIGDLCYVLHDEWDEVCDIIIKNHECFDGEFALENGVRFASYGTKYGDGCYHDQNDYEYGVDAGLIGCIRVEDIHESISDLGNLGHVYTFDRPFRTGSTPNGTIWFGHVEINTGDEEDDGD